MRRQGGRFGQIAMQKDILTEAEVHEYLKVQVSEVVFDAFVWTEGTSGSSEDLQMPDYAVTIASTSRT